MGKQEWFGKWFNSPYYHILYQHRDEGEARSFIDTLIAYLRFSKSDHILDVACGKGRHSIYLNEQGFNVTGIDLSKENIKHAQQFENETLRFKEWDMRIPFSSNAYDFVLNLFTSFGYFESSDENCEAINSIAQSLKPGGCLLLDFLNPYVVINNLVSSELKTIQGIDFEINRDFREGFIYKKIEFSDKGKNYSFEEKVKAIRRTEFLDYFDKANLKVKAIFGDYQLNQYVADQSERLIFLVEK